MPYSNFAEERIKEWRKKDREQTDFIRKFKETNKETNKLAPKTHAVIKKKDNSWKGFKEPKFGGFKKPIFRRTKAKLSEEVRDFVGVPKFLLGR